MRIKKVCIESQEVEIVNEDKVKDFQDKKFFDVDNALALIKSGEKVYSNFSYFERIEEHVEEKECRDFCPSCNAGINDIDWGDVNDSDNMMCQYATCNICGTEFTEIYEYTYSTTY